ncbi:MAG: M50 family metallopeptidase [Bacteroidales bacterium]|nr:M50 family metallopeptidase [Bacteroidales bacterium]
MSLVSKLNEKLSYMVWGRKIYLYVFGWLGTSVHEIGHVIFAILFRHEVHEIVLFSPNSGDSLGHIKHTYRKDSIYQNIGNFFIGIGPVILGALLLFLIYFFLFGMNSELIGRIRINHDIFLNINSLKSATIDFMDNILFFLSSVSDQNNMRWWKIVFMIYVLYAIGCSMTLSPADTRGALHGFLFFIFILFLFNLLTLWIGDFVQNGILFISSYFSLLYILIFISLLVNVGFVVILSILSIIKSSIFKSN